MIGTKHLLLLISIGIIAFLSCSSGTPVGDPYEDVGPDYIMKHGLLHGAACKSDKECKYGICYNSPNITHGAFRICTKDCSIPANGTCSNDNTDTVTYTSLRWGTFHPEEALTCMCVPTCNTVADCQAIDPRYNACENPGTGTFKVCIKK